METDKIIYTYRCGEKVHLKKKKNAFSIRNIQTKELKKKNLHYELISPNSQKIMCNEDELENLMSDFRETKVAHHIYEYLESPSDFLITDRIWIKFKSGFTINEVNNLLNKYSLIPIDDYNDLGILCLVTNATKMNPLKVINKLVENEDIVQKCDVMLNYLVNTCEFTPPIDEAYINQWHLHNNSKDNSIDSRANANVEEAWKLLGNYGKRDIVIGVTDDGCDTSHVDFNSKGKIPSYAYFVGKDLLTSKKKNMFNGSNHGTGCAGVAAAELDGEKTVGACPNARIVPLKFENEGKKLLISDDKLFTAFNFLADKVDIISNSWGGSPINDFSEIVLQQIRDLSTKGGRRGKGILFLWASGNENCPIDYTSKTEIVYNSGIDYNIYPEEMKVDKAYNFKNNLTGLPNVMFVGAITSTAQKSHYSNYGPGLDISAPSSNSHAYSRIVVGGKRIVTVLGGGNSNSVRNDFGGTSSATPLVAGIAALVLSANPNLSALEVKSILNKTASKDLSMEGYQKTPYNPVWDRFFRNVNGTVEWDVAPAFPYDKGDFTDIGLIDGTWSPWFGHGKVDAYEAVKLALSMKPEPIENKPELPKPPIDPEPNPPSNQKPKLLEFKVDGSVRFLLEGSQGLKSDSTIFANSKMIGMNLHLSPRSENLKIFQYVQLQSGKETGFLEGGNYVGAKKNKDKVLRFRLSLTGKWSKYYDIEYQARLKSHELTEWIKNGQYCGNKSGNRKRIDGVKIRIIKKQQNG